jgi:23S rRNA (cytosine1962-C5)-methyltransferase
MRGHRQKGGPPERRSAPLREPRAGGSTSARLVASAGAKAAALRGHPWVYRDQLRGPVDAHAAGDVVRIHDEDGAVLASAIVDPASPIAARLWTRGGPLDVGLILRRIEAALALRDRLVDEGTTAFRCVHGEGDRAPGIVIDRYGHVAVLRFDGDAIASWAPRLADPLFEMLSARGVRSLVLRSTQ